MSCSAHTAGNIEPSFGAISGSQAKLSCTSCRRAWDLTFRLKAPGPPQTGSCPVAIAARSILSTVCYAADRMQGLQCRGHAGAPGLLLGCSGMQVACNGLRLALGVQRPCTWHAGGQLLSLGVQRHALVIWQVRATTPPIKLN